MVLCAGCCSSTLRVTVTLSDQQGHLLLHCWASPWYRSLDFPATLTLGDRSLFRSPLCADSRAASLQQALHSPAAHISPLAQAAVPNCSGSQPTLSPFWFQVLMTVTSYFQRECFPTHGTANVQADLRSFFSYIFWVLSSSKGDDELFQMPIRSS